MANTSTVSALTSRVRSIADLTNSQFVTDAEILTWLNVGLAELWDVLVNKFEDYCESTNSFSLVADQSDYTLPSDFYKLLSVDYVAGGIIYTIPRYMNAERNRRQGGIASIADYCYRVVGNVIRFIPTPMAAGDITIRYVPQYAQLSAPTDLVHASIPQGWEEFAVLDAAIQCQQKGQLDDTPFQMRKQAILSRILTDAANRDANQPARVTDIYRRFYGPYWDMDQGPF